MLAQQHLIARVRELCHADPRLDAALIYGSFVHGEADAHSDVEFWLFFTPAHRAGVDPRGWCEQVAPLTYLVVNEFGTHVAFFAGLLRGEFHFATSHDLTAVQSWPARGAPVDRMIVVDRSGRLRSALLSLSEHLAAPTGEEVEALCGRFANWLVLAHHVTERGEVFRALDALAHVHRHLLWMARLAEGQTRHWLTPSRQAEIDLSPCAMAALRETVAPADRQAVRASLASAWRCGRAYWRQLADRYHWSCPQGLFTELDHTL